MLWVPHENDVFTIGRIIEEKPHGNNVTVEVVVDSIQLELHKSTTFVVDPSHMVDLDDLCNMNNLNEAPLLDILRRRFRHDKIYTNIGNFLVSLNPYRMIPGLYDDPLKYLQVAEISDTPGSRATLSPHVFGVANNALRELTGFERKKGIYQSNRGFGDGKCINQSIIISGESGAGKTEASKHVMSFLTQANNSNRDPLMAELGDKIKAFILDSNSVFESFGNAKTVRNTNSSRFGKYIKLEYTVGNHLVSANTETFLLERSRLVTIGHNERNYHIFYRLIRGLATVKAELLSSLMIENVDAFDILTEGGCTVVSTEAEDVEEFHALCRALTTIGSTEEELKHLWSVLASILHLGNLTYTAASSDSEPCILHSRLLSLQSVASILGIQHDLFLSSLTKQRITMPGGRGSFHYKMLSPIEAKNNVMALIKYLYRSIFSWVVRKVNYAHGTVAMVDAGEAVKFIGILDIFGFEILQTNSFEQLCINYTNERLQQQFNEIIFVSEQQNYASEGLDWTSISYRDNQHVIDLISKKPTGLLCILEEHCMLNRKPDDTALLSTYNQTHDRTHEAYARPRFGKEGFVVKHFAGDVSYAIGGFLAKNNDSLQVDLTELLNGTDNLFLRNAIEGLSLFLMSTEQQAAAMAAKEDKKQPGFIPFRRSSIQTGVPAAAAAAAAGGGGAAAVAAQAVADSAVPVKAAAVAAPPARVASRRASNKMASSVTVSYQFRSQLDLLISTLRATQPHYVSCIKPNNEKESGIFTSTLVMQQLRYSGVLEIVRIRREGFPTRVTFQDFYAEYRILAFDRDWPDPKDCDAAQSRDYTTQLATINLPQGSFQIGTNFIFLGNDGPKLMEIAIDAFLSTYAIKIQSMFRKFRAVRKFGTIYVNILYLQHFLRGRVLRILYLKKKKKIVIMQRYAARWRMVRLLKDIRRIRVLARRNLAAQCIQASVRGHAARCWFRAHKKRVLKAQITTAALQRKRICVRRYQLLRAKLLVLQKTARMFVGLRRRRSMLVSIRAFQRIIRGFLGRRFAQRLRRRYTSAQLVLSSLQRRRICVRRYRDIKRRLVLAQSAVRMFLAKRRRAKVARRFATLQRVVRGFLARLLARKMKNTLTKAQIVLSSLQRRRVCVRRYRDTKGRLILIQSMVRMFLEGRRRVRVIRLISKLQRVVRGYLGRLLARKTKRRLTEAQVVLSSLQRRRVCVRRYRDTKRRLVLIQSIVRMFLEGRRRTRVARLVATLQRIVRGYLGRLLARKTKSTLTKAQVVLSSLHRRRVCVRRYRDTKRRLILIQSMVRMFLEGRRRTRVAILISKLQRVVRGYLGRLLARKTKSALTKAQIVLSSLHRRRVCVRVYRDTRRRLVLIQSMMRMFLEDRRRTRVARLISKLQRVVRGYLGRLLARKTKSALTKAQVILSSLYRRRVCVRVYRDTRRRLVLIQSTMRMFLGKRRKARAMKRVATIQQVFRGHMGRRYARRKRGELMRLQVLVSSTWRSKQSRESFLRLQASVRRLQRFWRKEMEKKDQRNRRRASQAIRGFIKAQIVRFCYLRMLKALVLLQSQFRVLIQRRRYRATIAVLGLLQAWVRCRLQRKEYGRMRASSVRLQSAVRGRQARRRWALTLTAVRRLQRFARSMARRKRLQLTAAQRIQSQYRGHVARLWYGKHKALYLKGQVMAASLYRRRKCKRQYLMARDMINKVQSTVRMFLAVRLRLQMMAMLLMLQRVGRGRVGRGRARERRRTLTTLQICVAAKWRSRLAQRRYQRLLAGACKLQRFWRMQLRLKEKRHRHQALRVLRSFLKSRIVRFRYLRMLKALVLLQSQFRVLIQRRRYRATIAVLGLLQAWVRCRLQRKEYGRMRASSVRLQSAVRGRQARRRWAIVQAAIVKMQAIARMAIAKRHLRKSTASILRLQSAWRKSIAQKRFRANVAAVVTIQAFVRTKISKNKKQLMFESIVLIQSVVRMMQCRRLFRRAKGAATKIQACIRRVLGVRAYMRKRRRAIRLQRWLRATMPRVVYIKRIVILHDLCSRGDVAAVRAHLKASPGDAVVRNKYNFFCSVFHSAVLCGKVEMLQTLEMTAKHVVLMDCQLERVIHWAMRMPNFEVVVYMNAIMDTIGTIVRTRVMLEGDEPQDEDEEQEHSHFDEYFASINPGSRESFGFSGSGRRESFVGVSGGRRESFLGVAKNSLGSGANGKSSGKQPILMSGWLKARVPKGFFDLKRWYPRFFVLTEESLTYYNDESNLSKPYGYLSIEGCTIERVAGKEPILEITSVTVISRRSFFGERKTRSLLLMAASERDLQLWLNPLKAAAGVKAFRETPITHVNFDFRQAWMLLQNKSQEIPLHTLASVDVGEVCRRNPSISKEDFSNRILMMASWMVEHGSDVDAKTRSGKTAFQLALAHNNPELAMFLMRRGAIVAGMDEEEAAAYVKDIKRRHLSSNYRTLDPQEFDMHVKSHASYAPPVKLRGYSYLNLFFQKQYGEPDVSGQIAFDTLENPFLAIAVSDSKKEAIEVKQEMICPAVIQPNYVWWGSLWHMQTPIQNLEKGCAIRISLCSTATSSSGNAVGGGTGPGAPGAAGDARPESGLRIVEHAEAVFGIEKETVDSGRIKLSFRTVDETGFFPIRSCCILEAELIITKRYRNIDTQKSLFSILRDGGK